MFDLNIAKFQQLNIYKDIFLSLKTYIISFFVKKCFTSSKLNLRVALQFRRVRAFYQIKKKSTPLH